jgi:hypothetical protein
MSKRADKLIVKALRPFETAAQSSVGSSYRAFFNDASKCKPYRVSYASIEGNEIPGTVICRCKTRADAALIAGSLNFTLCKLLLGPAIDNRDARP